MTTRKPDAAERVFRALIYRDIYGTLDLRWRAGGTRAQILETIRAALRSRKPRKMKGQVTK